MLYDILVDFPGSQDGTRTEQFKAGTQRELSDWLAPLAVSAGWARSVKQDQAQMEIANKAVSSDGTGGPAVFRRGRTK